LQTFLGYAERAEKHRLAGAKYGALGRTLEQLRASETLPSTETIDGVRKRLDDLAIESANNPLAIYRKAGSSQIDVLAGLASQGSADNAVRKRLA
jgi:hypothetical protein